MQYEGGTTVVRKRMGFLSVLVMSLAAIIMTVVLCASGIAVYSLRIFDHKADSLGDFVQETLRSLPAVREALPPALADAIDDVRKPEYRDNLDVEVRVGSRDRHGWPRAVVEVTNKGDQVVSLLSMRLVGSDDGGDPVQEWQVWAATPIQIDNDWRGPILPGETRRFPVHAYGREPIKGVTHEVTELRIWRGETGPASRPASPLPETAGAASL